MFDCYNKIYTKPLFGSVDGNVKKKKEIVLKK